jgi:streptogramin lyase
VALCVLACGGSGGDGDGDGSGTNPTGIPLDGSGSGTDTLAGPASAEGTGPAPGTTTGLDGTATMGLDDSPVIFDVATEVDAGPQGGCNCGNQLGFSYIWIANSTQGTVSKLNTQTMAEEGRFQTRPDLNGSPSRTSVSIDSRAVAVANRNGGVVKVWARPEFCDPLTNGVAGLQTSDDANFLPWGEDDCVAWFTSFDYSTQRPVAWGPGVLNQQTCAYEDQVLWTGGCQPGVHANAQVHRLDGETGVVLDTVDVVGFECSSLSPYGAAIDPTGDYWMTNLVPGADRLAHIDSNANLVEVITPPITPYGMTVDSQGRVWLESWTGSGGASAARYDPMDGSWALANNHVANAMSGIQEDSLGRMWMNYWSYDGDSSDPGLVFIDGETMEVSDPFGIGCGNSACRGISVDLDGNVWSTSMGQNMAFRFNPDTLAVDTYNGLVGPYTYSDMTGWALQNTTCGNPEG